MRVETESVRRFLVWEREGRLDDVCACRSKLVFCETRQVGIGKLYMQFLLFCLLRFLRLDLFLSSFGDRKAQTRVYDAVYSLFLVETFI